MDKDTQTSIDGVIADASLNHYGCVYGTVVVDYKGRFNPEDWIVTSVVQNTEESQPEIIHTINSTYKIQNWKDQQV